MAVFWVVAPCSLVEVYQRFRGPCCLHHQGDSLSRWKVEGKSYSEPISAIIILSFNDAQIEIIKLPKINTKYE
jgi:hypothetical protein